MNKHVGYSLVTVRSMIFLGVGAIVVMTAMKTFSQNRAEPASPENQFLGATPLRGINLPVRSTNEAEITESTKRIPVEAFFDEDYGTLSYVTPSGGIASMPFPKDFLVRTAVFEGSVEVVRISVLEGTAWRMEKEQWVLIEEADDVLSVGNYDVQILATADGTALLRVDSRSGRTWFLDGNTWAPVAEAK